MDNIVKYENAAPVPQYNEINHQYKEAYQLVDDIILKNYINKLRDLEIVPLDEDTLQSNIAENVRFFKINEMVYQKDEYSTYKFASVFNAVANMDCAVFVIMDSNGEKTDFYMGIRSLNSERTTNSLKETLKNALIGQFPGIKAQDFLEDEMKAVLKGIKGNSISAVSCVAKNKAEDIVENKSFLQGLEKLALAMQGQRYTGIIIANGAAQEQLLEIRKGYENIYTQLSPFANTQISYSNNNAVSLSNALSTGMTKGTSYTTNTSYTETKSSSTSESTSDSLSKEGTAGRLLKGTAAAISIVGAVLAPVTGGASLVIGGVASGALSIAGSAAQKTETHGTTTGTSTSEGTSATKGESHGTNESKSENITDTKGVTTGTSQNIQLTLQNKSIIDTLERIDLQLKRLQECESLGMWECAAYFLSENQYAAEIAASTYKALMRGENSGVEVSAVNTWSKADGKNVNLINQYVTNFIHPAFSYPALNENITVSPCSLVSGNELAIHLGLPRKSICGFPVIEHADFGKEVVHYNGETKTQIINLGKIYNMGSECRTRVQLDRNSLSMHTFITGSTGSGKSNTVYEILDQLNAVDVNFLVIEPTKGEYKNIFGRRKNVTVLGTNPQYSELLKINPFKFPKKVHVLEHVDRLIEIFNVCWPMYAAMPAVLKDALLQAYEVCGWDLSESKNKFSEDLFPTFQDLQEELIHVIEESAYSQELKSNYIGSLATRVKSLTNGLNGQIFSAAEINNSVLFDGNTIVDLSRIGSLETKALIMGVLIMRLNEHRMSHSNGMNLPLRHVTVLEEAHNILKRTSTEQNPEAPSLAGKSVEMLSNAIAEMRTYGEGFIIADQSPNAVDISAIRNTNTKIVMRLPEEGDRRLAGKSAALKEEQLDEIAKLPKGVAIVYQNDWLEPVLCKISRFDGKEEMYKFEPDEQASKFDNAEFNSELLKLLLKGRLYTKIEVDDNKIEKLLSKAKISTKNKIGILHLLQEYRYTGALGLWKTERFAELSELVTELFEGKTKVENTIFTAKNYEHLTSELENFVKSNTLGLSGDMILAICQCMMKEYSKSGEGNLEIYSAWRKLIDKGGVIA
jgi:DNA helicase HerA-like ATPase